MSDPRLQLELREVIIVSSRDSSLTIRTTTNILLTHSKQLLNAARDVDALLPLDCSATTMGILDNLFWAEPWEKIVDALTCEVRSAVIMPATIISMHDLLIASSSLQELIELFEVAHAWQIDVIASRMPAWIGDREGWKCQQLLDMYEMAELPDKVHQAALGRMLALGFVAQLTCPQAGDLSTIMHQFSPERIYDAVKYLSNARLPLLSPHIAIGLFAQLKKLAEKAARFAGQDNQLQLVDALLHMRTYQIPLREAVMYLAVRLDPDAGGVKVANLGICIRDMLLHHLREAIRNKIMPNPDYGYAGMIPHVTVRKTWTGYLRPTP